MNTQNATNVVTRTEDRRRTSNGRRFFALALLVPFFLGTVVLGFSSAQAGESGWSTYERIGYGLSVSYCRVDRETWTWKFRNDENTTVNYLRFKYIDSEGEHADTLPVDLEPYQAVGGWTAFTASSRPIIRVTQIKRQ